ncbi:sugar-binding transcriptional regulator [Vallicoccus soli]|uniref:MarR family transcriptional regulator n=1 Tax=Vallicoccus soli TaxID=2339232 RepID=A0A3A3YXT0_9ACTN|nr:sugar-binding domain-containing protein [Vallicoccus soli]RJK95523.1 MarR family transcriptional regulator [Vallicoccus soli]
MPPGRDRQTLVKVASLYYLDGRSQEDIARTLQTSRSNVSRMLAAAKAQGLVQIRVLDLGARDGDLEGALRVRLGLDPVRVTAFTPGESQLEQVGALAAEWLDEALVDGQSLGVSWGSSLKAMTAAFATDRPRAVDVVPLVGGLSSSASLVSGQELVRSLATAVGGTYRYLHAPALLRSAAARDALVTEPAIRAALDAARAVDLAVVGLGAAGLGSSAVVLEQLELGTEDRARFEAAAPVGDTCCRFFDAEGRAVLGAVHDQVLAVDLDDLRRVPTVVGVAAGAEKAAGVLAAVRGGIVDGLVVDSRLALALLDRAAAAGA